MRIAIDARELAGQPTGVGRYLSEIVREWGSMADALQHEYVFCAPADMRYDGPLDARVAVEGGHGTLWEQRSLARLARRAAADVLFCPGYSGPVWASAPPTVVAVHDVSFAAHPEWFRWREGLRRRFITRASARRAARVLTLTEFSKREIIEHLGVSADRIEVVHPGVVADRAGRGFLPTEARSAEAGSPANTAAIREHLVLYVGSIFNRRHVPETIRGFEQVARRRPDVRLVIVGDNRTFPRIDIDRYVRDTRGVQIARYVSDTALAELYSHARAFVFLSEYEGFGLTPLEALAAGIPIVVLDTAVAREVYGAAALYVSAPDPGQVEEALERALFDDDTRSTVLREAQSIVARYSWRDTARRVLDVLLHSARIADSGSRIADRG